MLIRPSPRLPGLMRPIGMLWCLLHLLIALVAADNETQPISIFRSRPDLVSPILYIIEQKRELQAPGLYFLAPYQQIQESIHIFDNDANLVWSGFGSIGPGICHAPQVCEYQGEPHLCFYQGTQMIGWGHGHGVIMDKHYRLVKSIEPGSFQGSSDMHEFRVINGGKSALMTQYLRSVENLCDYDICWGLGYVQQGAFQEVDVENGKVLFQWRSLDHVALSESYVGPSTTEISGTGEQPGSPWDYFHINSVDKNEDGDYLVSARHVSCIYKISGKDGHVIWRLNGAKTDYRLVGFGFSSQHDARFVKDNAEETIITIFDNGSNGFNRTQPHSSGLIVRLDHRTKTALLVQRINPPIVDGHMHISKSQGNFQRLPNGNIILSWGNDAFWTEYTSDGETVFYGNIGLRNVMNYRVHKFDNWVGMPLTKPALWTYSKFGGRNDKMFFYVSWNGATEVRQWRFYHSDSKDGPFKMGPVVTKSGFETIYQYDMSPRYSYAEALDENMLRLGRSDVQETYVPSVKLLDYCDDLACNFMPTGDELRKLRAQEKEGNKTDQPEEEPQPEEPQTDPGEPMVKVHRDALMRKILIGALSGIGGIVLILAVYATRNYVSRPVARLRLRMADAIAGHDRGTYKALAMDEHEGVGMNGRALDNS